MEVEVDSSNWDTETRLGLRRCCGHAHDALEFQGEEPWPQELRAAAGNSAVQGFLLRELRLLVLSQECSMWKCAQQVHACCGVDGWNEWKQRVEQLYTEGDSKTHVKSNHVKIWIFSKALFCEHTTPRIPSENSKLSYLQKLSFMCSLLKPC